MDFRFDIAALCAAAAVILWVIYRRDRARRLAIRGAYLDECRSIVADPHVVHAEPHYPVLEGRYAGRKIRLEPVVDHMGVRKLPSLWLKVSVLGALPIAGTVDFLARPQNTEFYSPSARLPITLRLPPAWPQHALLRTDIEDQSLPIRILGPHIGLFADPKAKELVIAPRGVRLVYQASQAERPYYMVLRQAEFGDSKLPAAVAQRLLEQTIGIYDMVAALGNGAPPPAAERSPHTIGDV